jgi:hypothetical protein
MGAVVLELILFKTSTVVQPNWSSTVQGAYI